MAQLPQRSDRESIVGQGLGIVETLIEPRKEGYGYQVREGQLESVLETLHCSTGELSAANAAGFGAFEAALSSGLFSSALALKGQIEGPITLAAYLFHKGKPFLADPALFGAIAFHISQIIGWQINRLQAAGLPCFRQHIPNLTAFAKASFSGESPTTGHISLALGKIVDELTEIGALKAKGRAA